MSKVKMPTEHAEQVAVVSWLRRRGLWFFAVPNGAKVSVRERAKLKKEGLESGVPDLMVVDGGKQVALEMKRRDGGKPSKEQRAWLEHLEGEGWMVGVKHGAEEAIGWLKTLFG